MKEKRTEKIIKSSRIADEIGVTIELMEEKKKEIIEKNLGTAEAQCEAVRILKNEIDRLKEMYEMHVNY